MTPLLAIVVGCLYAAAVHMLLSRSLFRMVLGLVLLSHGANLLIFVAGRLNRGRPPIIPDDADRLEPPYADPLPQALILTAIVIGFGVLAFALTLFRRQEEITGHDDPDRLSEEREER